MASDSDSNSDVDAFMKRFWLLLAACFLIVLVPIYLAASYVERRFDSFESSLRFQAPNSGELGELAAAEAELALLAAHPVQGQTVYVPAYSHVYHQDGRPHLLTITLSLRNTSLEHPIVVTAVRYFDTQGAEVKSYLDKPLRVGPLATKSFLVERDDTSGGSGASFLVEWVATQPVTEPIVEAVMIDTSSQQGISFVSRGKVLLEKLPGDTE